MTDPVDPATIADLELKVHYLLVLVENLYQHLGIALPSDGQVSAAIAGTAAAGPDDDPQIRAAIASGDLIAAIKRYRELTGADLRQAKDAIETLAGR